ncbi:MAG: endonuclease III [archaeon]
MDKTAYFLKVFKKARAKYIDSEQRLAVEGWAHEWQVLIATVMSAQSRDTTTIPIAEKLFARYKNLEDLAQANYKDVLHIFRSLNYNKTKAKHVIGAAKFIISEFHGKLPDTLDELTRIPGVGRKTANIVLLEVHKKPAIAVDTHVQRISNVLGLVQTKTPLQTEVALKKIVPKKYWTDVNYIFVRWGQNNSSRDKKKLLSSLR